MDSTDYISINGLKIACIIGIFDWERTKKQEVLLDLKFPCDNRKAARTDKIEDTVDYKKIAKATIAFVEKSRFQLVETMAERLAEMLLERFALPEIFLTISKPGAIRGSQNVGVQIHRNRHGLSSGAWMALGLGSNLDPGRHLAMALGELEKRFRLLGCSHVYETSPIGYSRQPVFWNLAAVVPDPGGTPRKIRHLLGWIEKKAGRERTLNPNGPRTLDVDLLMRADQVDLRGKKKLPHPDLGKKAFVLFPLLEVMPWGAHPVSRLSFVELAASFSDKKQKLRRLPPETLASYIPRTFTR
jgi:2-amino-4-hydroxy-6-hydroxymethyldihydropteridine diphosphokinase